MFGTSERFDLTHAVYAREGSAFFLIENDYRHLLQLSSFKPGAWMMSNEFVFTLRTFQGGREIPYSYKGDPGSMGRLARCYRDGRGTDRDLATATEWYGKAIESGLAWAEKELAETQFTIAMTQKRIRES